ncbi:4-(cytidine 5'-diphospho)-2-C-methyl-D-erythritol kinase [Zooshikella marina]|uniref:4-(cytidine 5'-diphospho)-2-C-methyl-D-erythritol kinase n=1 Tax=Zooshikella ganghwensis TaxID=202772 RepID=UPI001BB093F4|nr:4-(cytidine 5'-diphospho)-2-C-methyl-D-erythritol kinase [Zooshikella ganghwensis]MBU2707224.1 4-(cytidine 5'-diphospho)-2-C-methyl-D-erythritol kinase [Zooshikella ganghwensis]
MQQLTLPAPAKLNLFLHILGRRVDGYHQLQTLFQFLDLADDITMTVRDDGKLNLLTPFAGLADYDNLAIKAAKILQLATNTSLGVDISIHKCLPMGGGVGGGSSNAATVLHGLNILWQTRLSNEKLAELGLQLGADVPVFVHGQAAWAEGVGEQLTPVVLPEPWFILVKPNCHISTAEIFQHPDLTRDSDPITVAAYLQRGARNDCEAIVRKRYPEVDKVFKLLNNLAPTRLTGTGACLFAEFADKNSAERAFKQLPGDLQAFLARGCNQSILHKHLQSRTNSI